MLALDTSGKISQFPIIVAVAKAEKIKIISELREKVRKRHKGIACRKRIKSSDLTNNELNWFMNKIDFPFRVVECDAFQYRTFKSLYGVKKKWKFVFLTLGYYLTISGLVKNEEEILLDQDYDKNSMDFIIIKVNYSQLSQGAPNFNGFSNHIIAGSGWFTTGHKC